jgi:hypothetical protein
VNLFRRQMRQSRDECTTCISRVGELSELSTISMHGEKRLRPRKDPPWPQGSGEGAQQPSIPLSSFRRSDLRLKQGNLSPEPSSGEWWELTTEKVVKPPQSSVWE